MPNKKRKLKKKHQKSKFYKKRNTKIIVASFSVLFAIFLIVGSTYSWITSKDEITNSFEGGYLRLKVDILEVYQPNNEWQAGLKTVKEIRVKNNGTVPAIVRVSLEEFLLSFEVNTSLSGTGNLVTHIQRLKPLIDKKDVRTWVLNKTYKYNQSYYHKSVKVTPDSASSGKGQPYLYDNLASRNATDLVHMKIQFNSSLKDDGEALAGDKNYWVYNDGYFYYSEVLKPGKQTTPLVDSVILSSYTPNALKGSLYQLKVNMDASDSVGASLNNWGIQEGTTVEQMLNGKLKQD